jgi:phosphatidate phosphatase APP1
MVTAMKTLALFLSFSASASLAGVAVVADLDDTIKIMNVANKPRATYNGIFGRKVFAGMPEFLAEAGE